MSVYEDYTHLVGGKICYGVEETASQLLWCEHCGIALCFDCDSHCHHAKNARSAHLRVLLPSSRTSTVPRCEHGADPVSAWGASARVGLSVDGSRSINLDSVPPSATSKDKRKRNKKKENSSSSLSRTETLSRKAEHGSRSTTSDNGNHLYESSTAEKVAFGSGTIVFEDGDNSVQESDTSDLSFSSSPEVASPLLLRAKSLLAVTKPGRSALRGGSEGVGLGPRPKQRVKWHPDVFDPICSTVSHTVGHKSSPAFLSRRSYQKHLRQKSKASSKSQVRGKKHESSHKSKKKGESSKSRSHSSYKSLMNTGREEESSELSTSPSNEDSVNIMVSKCTEKSEDWKAQDDDAYSGQANEAVDMPDSISLEEGYKGDVNESKHLKCEDVLLERPANTSVQEKPSSLLAELETKVHDTKLVKGEEGRKLKTSDDLDTEIEDFMDVGFPESCRKVLACMLHAAKSVSQNDTLGATVEYEAAAGLFREAERRARVDISGSEEVVKQAVRGQLSAWISVV